MMQSVSQSYSSSVYATVQNSSPSLARRGGTDPPSLNKQVQWSGNSGGDPATISARGRQLSKNARQADGGENTRETPSEELSTKAPDEQNLSQEELRTMADLQKRDTEVRAHEQAHLSAAGQYAAGGASFSYVTGPNGKRYANGGEVPIDISREKTPEATIQKMRTVRRAALAPANPSGADRGIAAQASSLEAQAMKELQEQSQVATSTASEDSNGSENVAGTKRRADITGENQPSGVDSSQQISGVSRKSMTSAYQAIAALAA